MDTFDLPFPRRPKTTSVAAVVVLAIVAVVATTLIYAWAGMVLLGIFGVYVGFGTCVAVAFLANILLGAVRGLAS